MYVTQSGNTIYITHFDPNIVSITNNLIQMIYVGSIFVLR